MSTKMFISLAVTDLQRSMTFFKALGFSFNAQFTDDTAACMVVSEENYVMLHTAEKWNQMIPRPISDTTHGAELVIGLSCDSREKVAEMVAKALAAGGQRISEADDYGFMYQDGFQDPDGHLWSFFWMDPSHIQTAG